MTLQAQLDAMHLGILKDAPNEGAAFDAATEQLPKVNGSDSFELPVPGTFVVDSNGIVRDAFVDPDYKKRMEPERIIEALAGLTRS